VTARKATIAVLATWLVAWLAACELVADELDDDCWAGAT